MQAPHPQALAQAIESWFHINQRALPWRHSYDPWQVWVSEVMLQQTRMEVVLPYFARFMARFPDVTTLASADVDEVTALWSGLGYYRRARLLHAGAAFVAEAHAARIPRTVRELEKIPGVGRYTAGAIASIAWNEPAPVVDGNVARVLARIAGEDLSDARTWELAGQLVAAAASPRRLNQGLMEVGALVCTQRNPRCEACPLTAHCAAFRDGLQELLPVPKPRRPPRRLTITLYAVSDGAGRLLMRREEGPLMTGMYHLPHGDASLLATPRLLLTAGRLLGTFRHTVTTRQIEFALHEATVRQVRDDSGLYVWIDPSELHTIAHPSYVKKAVKMWQAAMDPSR